jgi:hypothetical protein
LKYAARAAFLVRNPNSMRISSREKAALKLLFKEVLQQVSEEDAAKLMAGYRTGSKNIVLVIGESSYGADRQTAFSFTLTDAQSWRRLPEPVDGIQ